MREELFYQSRSQSFLLLMGTREAGLQGCYFHASLTYVRDKYCWRHMYHLVKKKNRNLSLRDLPTKIFLYLPLLE